MTEPALQRTRLAVLLVTLGVSIALVLGFFGRWHPALDAFSHFRLHLAVVLILCAIALIGVRQWLHACAALMLGIGCFVVTMPHLVQWNEAHAAVPADQPVYKLLQLNLFHANPNPKAVISLIARQHPDIITLEEVTQAWRSELELIKAVYPYKLDCRAGYMNTVLLSRRPIDQSQTPYCAPDGRVARAQINLNGRMIDVVAVHLEWPWPYEQAEMLRAQAPMLQMLGDTAIAAGDFNAVPWSETLLQFAELGGFTNVERFGPTWLGDPLVPVTLKFLGLPIDHIMTKGRIIAHSARTLEPVGSDHLPVLIEFSLAPGEEQPQPGQTVLALNLNSLRMP